MKANELMIGDWVYWNSTQGKRPVILKDWMRIAMECENCNPIPLTAEILEKNGFKRNEYEYKLRRITSYDNYYYIEFYVPTDNMFILNIECLVTENVTRVRDVITFVHELQHALRLCGMSELADNLKV